MTPPARLAAAAQILDTIRAGRPAEQALTNWSRANRYAGSKDRAAVRDLVFDVLRCRRSCAALGGGESGRALVIGHLIARGESPDAWLTGARYALAPVTPEEHTAGRAPAGNEALDIPDWIAPLLRASLGDGMEETCRALRLRAPVFLRWHAGRTHADEAVAALREDGVAAVPHPLAPTALMVRSGARRVRLSAAYAEGLVEIQDASSQALCAALPLAAQARVLDYCAGGGGKALALAARGARVWAHDADPGRMRDLPARAARARAEIPPISDPADGAPFDLVLTDVPCSGSGAWRRQVEAKWSLGPGRLAELTRLQDGILARAAPLVRPGGWLAYATCSLLRPENMDRIEAFLQSQDEAWSLKTHRSWSPLAGGDGFFLALLRRAGAA